MAKVTEEMINLQNSKSANEVKAKLNELLVRAKNPSARAALNNVMITLDSVTRSNSPKVRPLDIKILEILDKYQVEYMHSNNVDIDENIVKMINDIINVRGILSRPKMSDNKKKEFKKYKKAYIGNKKELKKSFTTEYDASRRKEEFCEKQVDTIGAMIKSYTVVNLTKTKQRQLDDINAQMAKLEEAFEKAKDQREEQRLESEYASLENQKSALDNTLQKLVRAQSNIKSYDTLLQEYNDHQAILEVDNVSVDKYEDIAAKINDDEKKYNKRNEQISKVVDERSLMRDRNIDRTAATSSNTSSLRARVERRRAAELDGITSNAPGGSVSENTDTNLDIDNI